MKKILNKNVTVCRSCTIIFSYEEEDVRCKSGVSSLYDPDMTAYTNCPKCSEETRLFSFSTNYM